MTIYKMIDVGNEYYADAMGVKKYYFDLLVKSMCDEDIEDSCYWLDGTFDLCKQIDLLKLCVIGDFPSIISNMKKEENIEITEIKNYKELLQFYVDYLNGEITNYYLYDEHCIGVSHAEMVKDMLDTLHDVAIYNHMSENEILRAFIDTKAYEIEEFRDTIKALLKNAFDDYSRLLDILHNEITYKNDYKDYEIPYEYLDEINDLRALLQDINEHL